MSWKGIVITWDSTFRDDIEELKIILRSVILMSKIFYFEKLASSLPSWNNASYTFTRSGVGFRVRVHGERFIVVGRGTERLARDYPRGV